MFRVERQTPRKRLLNCSASPICGLCAESLNTTTLPSIACAMTPQTSLYARATVSRPGKRSGGHAPRTSTLGKRAAASTSTAIGGFPGHRSFREASTAAQSFEVNPTPEPQTVVIRSSIPHRAVREVNLAEQDIGELNSTDGRVEFAMEPFHIRTVALIVNDAWRENVVGLAGRLPWDHQRDAGREAVQEVS